MPVPRRNRSGATFNLVVSVVFHAVIIGLLVFLAAREGLLGKQLKTIAVTMAPKEKPPEPEKPKEPEKPVEPPPEAPKSEPTRVPPAEVPPPRLTPPPTSTAPPAVAPPAAELPSFAFSDGAKAVESTSDPIALYRGYVEFVLRSKWSRPQGVADEQFVAEVELEVGLEGQVLSHQWRRGSGHESWDQSVRKTVEGTKSLGRPPPKNFPARFVVRFDVAAEADVSGLP